MAQQQGKNGALANYVEVNVRIEKFWEKFPNGRIETEIIKWENSVIAMKAKVYKDSSDTAPSAVGHAYEVEGSSFINKTSALENCETSVVGRALAILGFEIKKSIASKEEVANAKIQTELITTEQMSTLLDKAQEYCDIKGQGTPQEIFKAFKITNIKEISTRDAATLINKIDLFIAKAVEEMAANEAK